MSYTYEQVLEASTKYFKGDKQQAQTFVDFYALKDESGKYLELTPQDMEARINDSSFIEGVKIDLSRDNLFDEHGLARLKDSYMKEGEKSPQERYAFVSKTFSTDQYHAQRLYEYSSKHWLSYSTPLLSFGRSKRGLNISCFVGETLVNTIDGQKEIQDLQIGDLVLSDDGSYNEVEAIKSQESNDLYELIIDGDRFLVTGNHLFLTEGNVWLRVDELNSRSHQILQVGLETCVETKKLKIGMKASTFYIHKCKGLTRIVYDIQVANRHTFTVGKCKAIVHNCYLSFLADTSDGLISTLSEVNNLSMLGGGVGIHVKIRGADDKSVGVMPHLKTYDASSLAYRQGKTRRGSYATFLDISHPDIIQFIEMRKPTGDQNMRTLNLHHGVNISDKFMKIIEECMKDENYNDAWELIAPNSGEVVEVVSAKYLWQKLIELRIQTGEPYFIFIDEANRKLPQWLKDEELKIHGSNLCIEGDSIITISIENKEEKIKISDFVTKWSFGFYDNKIVLVKSFDEKNQTPIWAIIENASEMGLSTDLIEIETESGKIIRCTETHKILTKNRGWVEAKDLLETDELCEL